MSMKLFRVPMFAWVAGVAVLAISGWASADPPSRVARLGYMTGAVSFSPDQVRTQPPPLGVL